MIEVQKLTKYYGPVAAIEDVCFSVPQGEIVGFLGPNAAGKSTTMRILTGFSPPTRGTAKVAGFDITVNPIAVKQRVGYLPENVPLYGEMLVASFLRYVAEVKGIESQKIKTEVGRVMERCGLTHMARRVVRNLSKGYRQRVGLAQALIGNPPVLVLDEPTVGLDPQQIVEIRQVIKDLGKEHTVLLSTHILPEVTMVCERVIIINKGRVVAEDRLEHLSSSDCSSVEVEVVGAESQVLAALRAIGGVRVCSAIGTGRYRVEGAGSTDLAVAVAGGLAQVGLGLCELRKQKRTLEDIFLQAISTEEGAGR